MAFKHNGVLSHPPLAGSRHVHVVAVPVYLIIGRSLLAVDPSPFPVAVRRYRTTLLGQSTGTSPACPFPLGEATDVFGDFSGEDIVIGRVFARIPASTLGTAHT